MVSLDGEEEERRLTSPARYNGQLASVPSGSGYRPAAAAAPAAPGPSRNGWQSQNTTTAYGARAPTLMDWKPNPMWKPIRALSNMEMLPGECRRQEFRSRLTSRYRTVGRKPHETRSQDTHYITARCHRKVEPDKVGRPSHP
jgi:hypothetical protein